MRALAADPADRPTAAEMAEALQGIVPDGAESPPPRASTRRVPSDGVPTIIDADTLSTRPTEEA